MADRFDLLIVDSGPAGSAAGVTAARAGLRVALVDKSQFPREKLCGGGFTGRSARYMNEVFGLDVGPDLFLTSRRVTLKFMGTTVGAHHDMPPVHMTMRRDFDARLHAEARSAGCVAYTGVRLGDHDAAARRLTLKDGRALHYDTLIGADGVNSEIARRLFGRAFDPARIGFGLEVEAPRPTEGADEDMVEIDLGAATWGYGWTFPKPNSITIGVGGVHSRNPDMKQRLHAYLARHGIDPGTIVCKGQFLPFGDYRSRPGRKNILLAGDAAGLVDPITGEGIAWAMKSGHLAACAAIRSLEKGAPETALDIYRDSLGFVHGEMRRATRLRRLIYAAPLRRSFARVATANPGLQTRYMKLLAGERDYADLSPTLIPRLAMQLLRTKVVRR